MSEFNFSRSSPTAQTAVGPAAERLLTIAEAAQRLGIHAWALRSAIKRGEVPAYTAFTGRRLVRLSEAVAVIEASRKGTRDGHLRRRREGV